MKDAVHDYLRLECPWIPVLENWLKDEMKKRKKSQNSRGEVQRGEIQNGR